MEQTARDHLETIQTARHQLETTFTENEKIRVQLEAQRNELLNCKTELEKREKLYVSTN